MLPVVKDQHWAQGALVVKIQRARASGLQQALANEGDVLECGVFRGGTALLQALTMHARASRHHRMLHLFESFEGMPETVQGVDRLKRGDLSGTSVTRVEGLLKAFPFAEVHPGFIPATFVG